MKTSTRKAVKAIVELTTRELFHNYAQSTLDVAWESSRHDIEERLTDPLKEIHGEDADQVRRLFRDGNTMMLVGEAFDAIDKADVAEIIVTKRDGTTFTVANEDISY